MSELENIIFRHVDSVDYAAIKGDLGLFSIFIAIDGRRSVRTIARDDDYELDDLMAKIDQMDKMGLITAVDGTERDFAEIPSEADFLKLPNEFQTKIDDIDKQHQRLLDMLNCLGRVRKMQYKNRDQKNAMIGHVLGEMISYTISHFTFEESLMKEAKYEFFKPHQRVHELFVARANEYMQRFKAGEDISNELFDMLNRWLFSHIRNDDLAYAPVVKKKVKELNETRGGWLGGMLKRCFKSSINDS